MKNRILAISLFIVLIVMFGVIHTAQAQGLIDYGGYTTVFIPCTAMPTWFLVYHIPAGTPIVALMYSTAKMPPDDDDKNHLIPSFPLLGLAAPATIPCLVYAGVTVITIGVGFPVVM